ncbi:bifunctional dihydrofolate reductase-thymidylate synthase [Raphidocelis subcapitata]|uniref:Bifunctional dihydrofolate reductase-thymidylate synthase n=1 Tax=Raphidocelis subcapitata TaxID=307507 RepID=A0A2V0P9X6_9CHLO|nr:bifunctional dihydrofolate reductase-thymidylate synthase [Raphidocelis subcapitata]|eukprot:GBF94660.1 bifunctional dihydrofolate reductase-thymidylate synthase [Raphidocelis subcapitata]
MRESRRVFQIVVAVTQSWGIGKDGGMPWKLSGDLAYFRQLTSRTADPAKRNAVIMGRKTWESIPERHRPLPGRLNIVLTRAAPPADENAGAGAAAAAAPPAPPPAAPLGASGRAAANAAAAASAAAAAKAAAAPPPSVLHARSLDDAMALLDRPDMRATIEHVFVIGGGQVYRDALASPRCAALHVTHIEDDPPCDTGFPPVDPSDPSCEFRVWSAAPPKRDGGVRYSFVTYVRRPSKGGGGGEAGAEGGGAEALEELRLPPGMASRHDEMQYLDLVSELIREGAPRGDRTGTGTLSKFGVQMRFNLRHGLFPLLTSKRVFWRGVMEELLWFIRGSTNAHELRDRGVHIWDGNSSREFLDSCGLHHREEGDLGPVYGFQWRHFGAQYVDRNTDYTGQGVDQLAEVVRRIREAPEDRRIILTAWNPAALPDMALPPCHMTAQFYVSDGELSCQLYQRSADVGLGVPFNIASYALLTRMLAQVCGLKPGDFVHTLGDAHVYSNHVEPLLQQLKNGPRPFPRLEINPDRGGIDDFAPDDFRIAGYEPHAAIKMAMAV